MFKNVSGMVIFCFLLPSKLPVKKFRAISEDLEVAPKRYFEWNINMVKPIEN